MRFDELELEDSLLQGLDAMNFQETTPIQELTIPVILEGKDLIACAQTGTGKTAAYTLPILNRLIKEENRSDTVKAVIMAPTRELAQQIDVQFEGFSYFLPVSTVVVYGGGDGSLWDQQKKALRLGADIPFCIQGGTALAEGIGEKLTELPAPPKASILVAKPPIMVSTKEVYQSLKTDELSSHPDIDGMIEALKQGSLQGITDRMDNVLETVTVEQFPVIAQIKDFMKEHGAMNALMSGSGPTVFGIYKEEQEALAAEKALREMGLAKQIKVTQFYNGER